MPKRHLPLGNLMIDVADLQLTEEDVTRLLHPMVGGVILFARNYASVSQVTALIESIKALRSPELLVAVDQEGGRVQRFKSEFTELPAAAHFGELWDKNKQTAPIAAFESARTMARELIAVGIDFSFAPVFDVNTQDNDVIANRSFHTKPEVATELLGAYIDGMHCEGMVAIAKHFPGHGGVVGDSHHCLPEDPRQLTELMQHDLVPYQALIDEIDGVMTAHIQFVACDNEVPTYSTYWLNDVLQETLGFTGLVFSDDLAMEGAQDAIDANKPDIIQQVEKAQSAGCDVLLLCNRPELVDIVLAEYPYESNERHSGRLQRLAASRPN
ncbi:MAG: beta-N-acetylhexosaminidase [Pseudomonadota bacterium]